jgi:signal transduction histidine kinase
MLQLSLERTLRMVRQAEELAKREAEAAALRDLDRMKDELISTISHELRTPLTVIHGYASRLQRRAKTFDADAVEQSAERILASSTQLARLVSDLLDYSRAAQGQLEIESERFDLVPLIQELVPGFQARAGDRLVCELPDHLEVWGDRGRIGQVLANLVDNAAKYAPYGPIVVRAGMHGAAVRVEVQDAGPGVPLGEQERIWEKFFRGAQVTSHHLAQGSGIGLAVVKAIVEAQGGRVGVESTPGAGARFWFELPALAEEARPAPRSTAAAPTLLPGATPAAMAAGIPRHAATA